MTWTCVDFFAMAKIRGSAMTIRHPFGIFLPWPRSEGSAITIRHPFGMFFFLLRYQAMTRSENKLPNAQYTLDPQYFYRFWTPYKMTIRGAD